MKIPDPFKPLEGGTLHRLDKDVAEALTGVPDKTLSAHAIDPVTKLGVSEGNARAALHWGLVGALAYGGVKAAGWLKRNLLD